jgi:pimeloyl-ACP methyl ester carboxylesterase
MTLRYDLQDKYVSVNGLKIRYLEAGTGRPLVLVHALGVQNSADQWLSNFDELSKIAHVYAWDTPGWGHSDFAPDGKYTFPFWIESLRGFCDALHLEEVDIMGQSLGAWISALFVHQHPERVRRAVLLAMPGLNPQAPLTSDRFRLPTRDSLRQTYPTEAYADAVYDLAHRQGREQAFKSILDYINDPKVREEEWCLRPRLPEMKIPILFGQGDLNRAIPVQYACEAFQLAPMGRLVVIPGGGAPGGYNTPELVRAGIAFLTAEKIEPAH